MEEHLRQQGTFSSHIVKHVITPQIQQIQGQPNQIFPIAPISSLSQAAITAVYTLPAALDVEKLKVAIAKTLGIWRVVCSRLGGRDEPDGKTALWFKLTDSDVDIDVQTFPDLSSAPELSDKKVLQPLNILNPFLSLLLPSFSTPNSDAPLISFRLTLLPNRSVLGIQFGHILGDGATFLHFISHLSAMYADPSYHIPLEDYPVFEPHVGPLPELPKATLQRHCIPTMNKVPIAEAMEVYKEAAVNYKPFTFWLSLKQGRALKEKVGLQVSVQDAISAFFVLLLRKLGHPVEHLVYIFNYRTWHPTHPAFPPTLPRLSANVSQMHGFDLPPDGDLPQTANAIRQAILVIRDSPALALEWLSACSVIAGEASESKMAVVIPPWGWAAVNASYQFDFNVHFGFSPHETTYHTSWTGPAFLRVFKANPPCEVGDAELTFDVKRGALAEATAAVAELKAQLNISDL